MSLVESLALGLVLLFLAVAIIRLFKTPLKLALRTVGNTALGFGALWAVNLTTAYTGLSLGLNLSTPSPSPCWACPGWDFCCWSNGCWAVHNKLEVIVNSE